MNILLVSADPELVNKIFPALQYKVKGDYKIVHTAQECRELIKSGYHPNFAICDYDVPPGNGIDVIMQIRQKEELDNTRILLTIEPEHYMKAKAMVTMLKATMKEKPVGLFDLIRFLGGLN